MKSATYTYFSCKGLDMQISIHAPMKSATLISDAESGFIEIFQSTHP